MIMSKQLLFCVETSSKAETDIVYIRETISNYYDLGNNIRIRFICFEGKGNYKKKDILKKIAEQVKRYKAIGTSHVIYCIDTDRYDTDPVQLRELDEIKHYCEQQGYDLIWFCRDVEDVFWGEQIHKDEKTRMAIKFRSSRQIRNVEDQKLRCEDYARHKSNILHVLDKHLYRKSLGG